MTPDTTKRAIMLPKLLIAITWAMVALGNMVWLSTQVAAATIENREGYEVEVTIIETNGSKTYMIKAGEVLRQVCAKGCVIRLDGDQDKEYELEGAERVSIEDSLIYYDGADTPQEEGAPAGGTIR